MKPRFSLLFVGVFVYLLLIPASAIHAQETPSLLLNGVDSDISVGVNTPVTITASEGALIGTFPNDICVNEPQGGWQNGPVIVSSSTVTTMSAIAYLVVDGENSFSRCYVIDFVPPAPPMLLLNGQAGSVEVPVDTEVGIQIDPGAEVGFFYNEICDGEPSGGWVATGSTISSTPMTISIQARWSEVDFQSIQSPCYTITFLAPPPPVLLLNGQVGSVEVPIDATVSIEIDPGAEVGFFYNEICEGAPSGGWVATGSTTSSSPMLISIRARWSSVGIQDITSDCFTIRYLTSAAPRLTLNGDAESPSVSVNTNEPITIGVDSGATAYVFPTADCSGTPEQSFGSGAAPITSSIATVKSIYVRWDSQSEPVGPCRILTWIGPDIEEPEETETPPVPAPPGVTPSEPPVVEQPEPPTEEPAETATAEPSATVDVPGSPTDPPEATISPTASGTNAAETPTSAATKSGDNAVTGLPDTGTGSTSGTIAIALVISMAMLTMLVGMSRPRQ